MDQLLLLQNGFLIIYNKIQVSGGSNKAKLLVKIKQIRLLFKSGTVLCWGGSGRGGKVDVCVYVDVLVCVYVCACTHVCVQVCGCACVCVSLAAWAAVGEDTGHERRRKGVSFSSKDIHVYTPNVPQFQNDLKQIPLLNSLSCMQSLDLLTILLFSKSKDRSRRPCSSFKSIKAVTLQMDAVQIAKMPVDVEFWNSQIKSVLCLVAKEYLCIPSFEWCFSSMWSDSVLR